jgi:hypothetical protein
MSRKKTLTEFESERLRSSSDLWVRIEVRKNGLPECIAGIPKTKVHAVFASASSVPATDSSGRVAYAGLDVYRYAEIEDDVLYNKDHYTLVMDTATGSNFIVVGPEKDDEHWTNDLPALPNGLKVIKLR